MWQILTSGLVMLTLADTVCNIVAFKCLGVQSTLLSRRRIELVSKHSEHSEQAIRAAVAAAQFRMLAPHGPSQIGVSELVSIFSSIDGVTPAQARAVSS